MAKFFSRFVLLLCIVAPPLSAQQFRGFPPMVREHGDMQRLQFEGQFTVDPEDLRSELDSSLDVIQASRPSMQLSNLMEVIDRELLRGFLASGFPDATVATRLDEAQGCLVVTINEGPLFKCGGVVVSGLSTDRTEFVQQKLIHQEQSATAQAPQVPPKKPEIKIELNKDQYARWFPDKPCDFSAGRLEQLRKSAVRVLEDAGLYCPDAIVTMRRNPEQGMFELLVDPGPRVDPQLVTEINITGLLLHQPADIVALLDLRTEMPWSPGRQRDIEQRLTECGRFIDWNVTAEPVLPNSNSLQLKLHLVENLRAPLLTEELSDSALVFLRTSKYLQNWEQYGEDFNVEFKTANFAELVYQFSEHAAAYVPRVPVRVLAIASCQGGTLVSLELETTPPSGYRFMLQDGRLRLDSLHRRQSVESDRQFEVSSVVQGEMWIDKAQDAERYHRFQFSIGVGNGPNAKGRAKAKLSMAPSFAIASPDKESVMTLEDGSRLVIAGDQSAESTRVEFDVATGRFLKLTKLPDGVTPVYLSASMQPQAFDTAYLSIELGGWSIKKNASLGDILEFVGDEAELLPSVEQVAGAKEALRWLSLFSHLTQQLSAEQSAEHAVKFHIPVGSQQQPSPMAGIAAMLTKANALAFARESLLGQFGREMSLLLSTGDQRSMQEMERVLRHRDAGPLLGLYSAEVLAFINPAGSRYCAERGLRVIDDHNMSAELAAMFGKETRLGQVLIEAVNHLRQLPADERALLLEVFPEGAREGIEIQFTDSNVPAETVVLKMADVTWNTWGRELVRKRLLQHAPTIQQTGG